MAERQTAAPVTIHELLITTLAQSDALAKLATGSATATGSGIAFLTISPFENSQTLEMSQHPDTSTFPEIPECENRFVAAPAEPEQFHHRGAERAERTVDFSLKQILERRKITNMAKPASKDTTKDKLLELKAKCFTPEDRENRIARALGILSLPSPSFKVDKETWIWAAQEAEIEDI
jgi:hypothetical protein